MSQAANTDRLVRILRHLKQGGASKPWLVAVALSGGSRDPAALLAAHRRLAARPTRLATYRGSS